MPFDQVSDSGRPASDSPSETLADTRQGSVAKSHEEEEEEHEEEIESSSDLEKRRTQNDHENTWDVENPHDCTDHSSRPASRQLNRVTSRSESIMNTLRARKTVSRPEVDANGNPVTPQGFTHPLSHQKTAPDVIVDFDGPDDPYRPINWAFKKKVITTMLYAFTTMGTTLGSSIFSTGSDQISQDFGVGSEVATLGTALYLFGMGIGPLIWAPLSELYGRKMAVLVPYFIGAIFSFGTATAKDIQTVVITRFFTGFFGSGAVTNTGGVLGDIWPAQYRGNAVACYAMAVVGGPTIGPLIGGAIVSSYLRWRWTEYLTGIFMMFILVLDILILDESYGPQLLVYKARRLRHVTGNWALHARHEEWDVSLRELSEKYLVRPFQMLFTPICALVAVYASFVYGIVYAYLAAFPIIFEQYRHWGPVVGALPFVAIFAGTTSGVPVNLLNNSFYFKRFRANGNKAVPEARLPPMMAGGIIFSSGLFIFAWTCAPDSIFWFAPIVGCFLMGHGFFTVFLAALNYLVDTFTKYGASAVAANTFLRSCFAGGFPLFIGYMIRGIGPNLALTIFGILSAILIPVPWVFYTYGRRIRARGKWSRPSTL